MFFITFFIVAISSNNLHRCIWQRIVAPIYFIAGGVLIMSTSENNNEYKWKSEGHRTRVTKTTSNNKYDVACKLRILKSQASLRIFYLRKILPTKRIKQSTEQNELPQPRLIPTINRQSANTQSSVLRVRTKSNFARLLWIPVTAQIIWMNWI
jgi:hypothetical protein